jgi:hypothetical protein
VSVAAHFGVDLPEEVQLHQHLLLLDVAVQHVGILLLQSTDALHLLLETAVVVITEVSSPVVLEPAPVADRVVRHLVILGLLGGQPRLHAQLLVDEPHLVLQLLQGLLGHLASAFRSLLRML